MAALAQASSLGFEMVKSVKAGKIIEMTVEAENIREARSLTKSAADQLLANPAIEEFTFQVRRRHKQLTP